MPAIASAVTVCLLGNCERPGRGRQAVLTDATAVVRPVPSARKISSLRCASFGVTRGMVSMVLTMAQREVRSLRGLKSVT